MDYQHTTYRLEVHFGRPYYQNLIGMPIVFMAGLGQRWETYCVFPVDRGSARRPADGAYLDCRISYLPVPIVASPDLGWISYVVYPRPWA